MKFSWSFSTKSQAPLSYSTVTTCQTVRIVFWGTKSSFVHFAVSVSRLLKVLATLWPVSSRPKFLARVHLKRISCLPPSNTLRWSQLLPPYAIPFDSCFQDTSRTKPRPNSSDMLPSYLRIAWMGVGVKWNQFKPSYLAAFILLSLCFCC